MGQKLLLDTECDPASPLGDFYFDRIGDQSILHVTTIDGRRLTAVVTIEDAAWIHHEASQNAAAMVLQSRHSSHEARQVARMLRRGLRPNVEKSHVRYDPLADEYGYLLQFQNRSPVPIRMTRADVDAIIAKEKLARALALSGL
jgi:hypothetical protein